MTGYIKGLSYTDAKRAMTLINTFAQDKIEDESLSFDERVSWKNVYANITSGAVAVGADTQLQIHQLNVVLQDNDCGFIDGEVPYTYKTPAEKESICISATTQHVADTAKKTIVN